MILSYFKKTILLVTLLTIAISLSGCLDTLKKKYNEGAAATQSVVNTTKKLLGGTDKTNQQTAPSSTTNTRTADSSGAAPTPRQKTSYELEGEANESKYEHITFKSEKPDIISSATFRSYNGLYVEPVKAWNRDIEEYLKPYHNLLLLKDNYKRIDKHRLKNVFDGNYSPGRSARAWDDAFIIEFITDLAIKTRAFKACEKELCTDDLIGKHNKEQACLSLCARQRIGWTMYNKSVFDKKRSFNAYLDNELDAVIALANEVKHEAYAKGQTRVSSYQFNEGGFVLQDVRHITVAGITRSPAGSDSRNDYPVFKGGTHGSQGTKGLPVKGVLYKISPDEAEKFNKKLESNAKKKYKKILWYVFKVKLKPGSGGMFYEQVITSPTIEFYFDETLKNKAFELPVK